MGIPLFNWIYSSDTFQYTPRSFTHLDKTNSKTLLSSLHGTWPRRSTNCQPARLIPWRQVSTPTGPGFTCVCGTLARDPGSSGTPVTARCERLALGASTGRSLAGARALASDMRTSLTNGGDPATVVPERAGVPTATPTFRDCAEALIASKRPGWRNPKHAQQWGAHASGLRSCHTSETRRRTQ